MSPVDNLQRKYLTVCQFQHFKSVTLKQRLNINMGQLLSMVKDNIKKKL